MLYATLNPGHGRRTGEDAPRGGSLRGCAAPADPGATVGEILPIRELMLLLFELAPALLVVVLSCSDSSSKDPASSFSAMGTWGRRRTR